MINAALHHYSLVPATGHAFRLNKYEADEKLIRNSIPSILLISMEIIPNNKNKRFK